MRQQQITKIAHGMKRRFGAHAVSIARQRALVRHRKGEHGIASLWGAVAATVRLQAASPPQATCRPHPEPSLNDVMEGEVTKQVMAAYDVNPDALRRDLCAISRGGRRRR